MSTPERQVELLGPFGRAWQKLSDAYERRIETLSKTELEELILACSEGRFKGHLEGPDYWASTEVERKARAALTRLTAKDR